MRGLLEMRFELDLLGGIQLAVDIGRQPSFDDFLVGVGHGNRCVKREYVKREESRISRLHVFTFHFKYVFSSSRSARRARNKRLLRVPSGRLRMSAICW